MAVWLLVMEEQEGVQLVALGPGGNYDEAATFAVQSAAEQHGGIWRVLRGMEAPLSFGKAALQYLIMQDLGIDGGDF